MGDAFSTFGADETDDGCTGFSPFYAGSWLEGIPELYSVSVDFLKTGNASARREPPSQLKSLHFERRCANAIKIMLEDVIGACYV